MPNPAYKKAKKMLYVQYYSPDHYFQNIIYLLFNLR